MKKGYCVCVPGTKGMGCRFQCAGCGRMDIEGDPRVKPGHTGRLKACISEAHGGRGFGKRLRKGRKWARKARKRPSGTLGNGRGGLPGD